MSAASLNAATSSNAPVLALHQLSLYNSGRMPPAQIIAAFAARQPLLVRILADLASEKAQSRAQKIPAD